MAQSTIVASDEGSVKAFEVHVEPAGSRGARLTGVASVRIARNAAVRDLNRMLVSGMML
jgi:hypothetical protein